ncbi:MAG: 4Fe-4S dicluster domain-containing protein, partial [Dehalococcoidales bacterium]|nr:4Fe-4S dicluster domain-containing protein [Dehalococcoidales bacterium]
DKLDFKFREEIASQPGGENIKRCFACGTCSASCPITEIDDRFNPRKIIRMALLGMKQEVISSDFIWLCSVCHLCYERCPQDVRFTSIIHAIRNIAIREMKEGRRPITAPGFLFASSFLETVKDYGRVWEPGLILKFFSKKKDFKGILAYAPLGIKMFRKGKVPLLPSRGGGEVKHIFKKIQEREER